ncbi:hypothetical protein M2333_002301 [Sphingobium sp. B11D3B]|nr:hypothetical protein [Sphingobium sp. B11D3B]MCW2389255.1 hypothetical protein [Sphingobium sp. B11D3B]
MARTSCQIMQRIYAFAAYAECAGTTKSRPICDGAAGPEPGVPAFVTL